MEKINIKKAYIIHGWGGNSEEGWLPWLKEELKSKGFEAVIFDMPDTENPKIETWVKYLEDNVQNPNEETILVGHSIGCQTILRYLEELPENVKVGKVIFVAPWMVISGLEEEEVEIARPWVENKIDESKVLSRIKDRVVCIFSDDDPYVPAENQKIFQEKYNAEIVVEHAKGHLNGEASVTELPEVLERILKKLSTAGGLTQNGYGDTISLKEDKSFLKININRKFEKQHG